MCYYKQVKKKVITSSDRATKKLGADIAKKIISMPTSRRAVVVSLEGDLGAGKTTFTKGFAKALGVRDTVQSPTYVILKTYKIKVSNQHFNNLVHLDAYRVEAKDLSIFGWRELAQNPHNIILIEWGDRIKKALPKRADHIFFQHLKKNKRLISF